MTEPGYRWLSEVLDIVDGATVEAGAIFDDQWQREARQMLVAASQAASDFASELPHLLEHAGGAFVVDAGASGCEATRLAVLIGLAVGRIVEHGSAGPQGMIGVVDRQTQRLDQDGFHTDSTPWPEPNAVTLLGCVEADPAGGGATEVCWLDDILEFIRPDNAETVLRAEPVWWPLGPEWFSYPVLFEETLRWHEYVLYERRCDWPTPPSSAWEAAAKEFRAALNVAPHRDHLLRAGQVLVIDNRRALHRRGPVAADSARTLIRIKASPTPGP